MGYTGIDRFRNGLEKGWIRIRKWFIWSLDELQMCSDRV